MRKLLEPVVPAVRWVAERKTRRDIAQWLRSIEGRVGGFAGKAILDVGTDLHGNLVRILDRQFSPREAVGINLDADDVRFSPKARLEKGDVLNLPYPEGHFDIIISSSAFEHISGLGKGLSEMHRVLKIGGYLYSHFGPIWSTSYGHHLWTTHRGRLYTYWNVILPPYCHLLMTAHEIEGYLKGRGYDDELSRVLSEYVTASNEQNRMFFEDYEELFTQSKLEILMLKGYDHPMLARLYVSDLKVDTLDVLRSRYPGKQHFFYDGITTLLRKPSTSSQ